MSHERATGEPFTARARRDFVLLVDRCDLAWAAGFFDGEGWADAVGQTGRRTRQPQARVNQAAAGGIPQALLRLQASVGGLGRIGGPRREEGRVDIYHWYVSSRGDVERLRVLLEPWLGQVKLTQLAEALGLPVSRSTAPEQTDEWRAWAAGFYDGEGSLYLLRHRTHPGHRFAEMRITQGSASAVPEVLERFAAITRRGRLYGPYIQKRANLGVYRWNLSNRFEIEATVSEMWPWLGSVKRAQASAVFEVLRSQPALPRGRIDWGSHKTHCIRGHEYARTRMRPYVSRGVGVPRRANHQCLQCAREQARARREHKKRPTIDDDRRSLSEHLLGYYLLK